MTKTCVVCKKQPIPGDTSRSFHKFPPSEEYKKLWMEATGITKLSVNYTVCSDHFTPESFHQTDGYTSVNRLVRNAVPIKRKSDIAANDAETEEIPNGAKSTNNGASTTNYISCRIPVLESPTQPVPPRNGVRKRVPNTNKNKANKNVIKNNTSPCKAPGDNIVHITLPILKVKRNDLPVGTIADSDSSDNMLILNNSDSCALLGNISHGAANTNCKLDLSGEVDPCKSTQNDVTVESPNLPCEENAVTKRMVVISAAEQLPTDAIGTSQNNIPVATRKSTRVSQMEVIADVYQHQQQTLQQSQQQTQQQSQQQSQHQSQRSSQTRHTNAERQRRYRENIKAKKINACTTFSQSSDVQPQQQQQQQQHDQINKRSPLSNAERQRRYRKLLREQRQKQQQTKDINEIIVPSDTPIASSIQQSQNVDHAERARKRHLNKQRQSRFRARQRMESLIISSHQAQTERKTKKDDSNYKERYCFRDGAQQEYLYRSDFVSEEAWNKFLRLMQENKRRLQAMRQRLSRKRREYLSKHSEESPEGSREDEPEMYGAAKFLEVVLNE